MSTMSATTMMTSKHDNNKTGRNVNPDEEEKSALTADIFFPADRIVQSESQP